MAPLIRGVVCALPKAAATVAGDVPAAAPIPGLTAIPTKVVYM
ncbi:hypothetical protein CsSME_00031765 [Camellia sinensis var. sinensis]